MKRGITGPIGLAALVSLATLACQPDKLEKYPKKYNFLTDEQLRTDQLDQQAKTMVTKMLNEPPEIRLLAQPVIRNEQTAVAVAEALAFDVFGEAEIKGEQPYVVIHIDNYWVITGTLKEDYVGGVFEVILDAKDGRVLRLSHGE